MTLQKRVAAPGKARRAAKNKPRHTKVQKALAAEARTKKAPRKSAAARFHDPRGKSEEVFESRARSTKRAPRSASKHGEKSYAGKNSMKSETSRGAKKSTSTHSSFGKKTDFAKKSESTSTGFRSNRSRIDSRKSSRNERPARNGIEGKQRKPRLVLERETVRVVEKRSIIKPDRKRVEQDPHRFEDKKVSNVTELRAKTAPVSSGKTFRDLGIPTALANALYVQGITNPFPIQEATLPDALAGHDILGRGQTGSGKTLAFSLAMLTRISGKQARAHHPLALILTPTRELAQQIDEVLHPLARACGHESVVIAGGMAYGKQINAMRKKVAILVATPGRLIDLLNKGEVVLDDLEITVLDEADQMADMGFLPVVKEILDQAKPNGQRMLFSATLDRDVDSLVKTYLKDPKVHSLHSEKSAVETMDHYVLVIQPQDKEEILAEIASREGKTIIFVKTQRGADRVTDKLMHAGVPAGALHGGKSQAVRTRMLQTFKDSPTSVLVATDVAARGIHVNGISLVVHADPAQSHKDYLHRSGRTARAGESGTVVSIAPTRQRKSISSLVARAGVTATQVDISSLSPELVTITGAKKPSGIPYVAPKEEKPKSSGRSSRYQGKRDSRGGRDRRR